MKILHSADIHYPPSGNGKEAALESLDTLLFKGADEHVDLFVIAGDLFDRAIPNTGSGGLPALQDSIKNLLLTAPVVVVEGTPTHDIPGCYDIFQDINAAHNFTIIKPGLKYFLSGEKEESLISSSPWEGMDRLLILGCPEPTKTWLLANREAMSPAAANEAMREEMRKLLLGYGAIRKKYPDMPCIFVYHGMVAGAKMCNGQILQGGLSIGKDDLALVGADYYALGHIHLAQTVGDLPAYYPGSAYPVDWGELDQKGFNLVEIKAPGETTVKRVDYPHPPRKKITIDFENHNNLLDDHDYKGYQTWIEITISKKAVDSGFDPKILEKLILENDAEPGSKVTLSIIPTETVRVKGIAKAKRLRDKVKMYAVNSDQKIDDSVLAKADSLEAEAKKAGLNIEGLHIRIRRLKLRGAIGIWKGQHKDEIELDLDQYEPGLLVLIGKNGKGKTTLIENLQPFPTMPTHPGKLQDQFRLRDSYRDLYFTDEKTGIDYRALLSLDGENATGKAEFYLFKKNEIGRASCRERV